ncbi:MAG: HAD family phosphatase [Anaerohalosphaeraceae bacterium]|nr:HAD family phosphatase [Anaerohalosphaeraceae bacterium]
MLKAVIFDFDGVISDSELLHWQGFNEILARFDIKLSKQDYYDNYLGFTDSELLEKVMARGGVDFDKAMIEELVDEKADVFSALVKNSNHIINGVREFLAELSGSNIPMAICSGASSADIDVMLSGSELGDYFRFIVSADDVIKGKPEPDGYLLALQKLNELQQGSVSAGQCVVIEDSHWGIEAGKKAGMRVLAVTNSYVTSELKAADKTVESLGDLKASDLYQMCD